MRTYTMEEVLNILEKAKTTDSKDYTPIEIAKLIIRNDFLEAKNLLYKE